MLTLNTSVQQNIRSPRQSISLGKETKVFQLGEKEVKLCLFTQDMILHVENI